MVLCAWDAKIESKGEIVEEMKIDEDLRSLSADIIARACFGSNYEKGQEIFTKLRLIQQLMSKTPIGIPGLRYAFTFPGLHIYTHTFAFPCL